MKNTTYYFLLASLLYSALLSGQTPVAPKVYACAMATEELKIDGLADETAWNMAVWTDDFADIEGEAKPLPAFRTRIKMLWDKNALYIFAELEEPHIWASLTERDQVIFYDNDFEVFMDPDGDHHNYFELETNAFSTAFDLYMNMPYDCGGNALIGWDIAGLEIESHITGTLNNPNDTDQYWTIEMAIPWQSMLAYKPIKSPPKSGEIWRMNFSRVQWQTEIIDGKYKKMRNPESGNLLPENNWVWSPQDSIDMHLPEKWGYVIFEDEPENNELSASDVDQLFEEKQVLIDLFHQQKVFQKKNKRYAESLYELNKQGRSSQQNIFIESTSKQFLISINLRNGESIFINHQKRVWVE